MSQTTPGTQGVQGLEPSITYIRDGVETEITMSMGLLNKLLQAVGNYSNVALVGVDPFVNDIIFRKILTLRDKKGRPILEDGNHLNPDKTRVVELEDMADVEVSPEDCGRLLLFCQAHMVDFTIRAAVGASKLGLQTEAARKVLSDVTHGLNGSLALTSPTPVASPSSAPGQS